MKKLKIVFFAALLPVLVSCNSSRFAVKYPDMVADADPVTAGNVEAVFERLFSSNLNKTDIEAIFYPRYNTVALSFKYQTIQYRLFWNETGRRKFAEALELYKTDYFERNLIDKYRKTRSVYGKIKGQVEWETFRFSKTHISNPELELGYRFRNKLPFFTILIRSAKEESDGGNNTELVENQQINIYFTRAQAEELVKIFDQSFLLGLLGPKIVPETSPEKPEYDAYLEYND